MDHSTTLSKDQLRLIAARFKVLSDPMRLCILNELRKEELCVNDIVEKTGASQPNVSKHLKLLQSALIVKKRKERNQVFYSIADETIFELCEVVCGSLEKSLKERASVFA